MALHKESDHQAKLPVPGDVARPSGTRGAAGRASLVGLLLAAAVLFGARFAAAEAGAPGMGGLKFDFGLSGGFTSVDIDNAHFGLGVGGLESRDPNADYVYLKDVSRAEAYLAPRVSALWESDTAGTFHGGLRVVGAATRGDGDPWYLTVGNPSNADFDNAYVGWKSGNLISALGKDALEVSYGRQNFQLGDGMVLIDGNNEANKQGAIYWLDPQQGWENAGILRLNAAPVRLELFSLGTNEVSGNDRILGGNFELVHAKLGTVGVSLFKVTESDAPGRDELQVTGVHGRGRPLPFFPLLELAAEVDLQKNDNPEVDARAWFLEANLSLYMLPWYPTIGYRYASFSGDDAGTADTDEGWDPLHYGATSRGFGYWYQGIVVGTYETILSNLDTHYLHLTLAPPIKGSWVKVLYYDHRFNDTSMARLDDTAVSSDRFATEWDVILGYSPSKAVDYMFIYGKAKPGQGGRERTYGADKDEQLIQFAVMFRY